MATSPQFIATYRSSQSQLVAAHATRPIPIWTPGANGSRLHAIAISTNDTNPYTVTLFRANTLTLASNMGTTTLTKGTPDTISRSTGSFLTDGWIQNQRIFVLGATTLANDVASFLSAAVSSGTLTLTASTFNTTETFAGTGKLLLASLLTNLSLPAGAGSSARCCACSQRPSSAGH